MKKSRWFALSLALLLLLGGAIVVAAFQHTVQYGDTLFSLARRYGTTVSDIAAVNNIPDPNKIYVNQRLEIPDKAKVSAPGYGPAPASSYHGAPAHPPAAHPSAAPSSTKYHDGRRGQRTYVVQAGDTLFSIALRFNTTVDVISLDNQLDDPDDIQEGQVLVIPGDWWDEPVLLEPESYTTAVVGATRGDACTRLNFLQGRNARTGSRAGLYVLREYNGRGDLATWQAKAGATDSGWIEDIWISFDSVNVTVTFYPADGGLPILMEIVNPAPNTDLGWLGRGMCHAIEIQYPDGYYWR